MNSGITLLDIALWRWLVAFGIILAYFVVVRIVKFLISRPAEKIRDRERARPVGLFLETLPGPAKIALIAPAAMVIGWILQSPAWIQDWIVLVSRWLAGLSVTYFAYLNVTVLEFYLLKLARRTDSKLDDMLVPMIRRTVKVLIVIIFGTYVAEGISGKPITTILTGLGLGGLAFALAAQDTIKNLFGSLMILSDKPFMVGDWVKMTDIEGIVEDVGFRSTRIRTFPGELVTIPNEKVAAAVVVNVSRRQYIRTDLSLSVIYSTPPEKLEQGIEIARQVLMAEPMFPEDRPPRIDFASFGPDYLEIKVRYWYTPPDYWEWVDYRHRVNLAILKEFNRAGIEFAFPTRTVYRINVPERPSQAAPPETPTD